MLFFKLIWNHLGFLILFNSHIAFNYFKGVKEGSKSMLTIFFIS